MKPDFIDHIVLIVKDIEVTKNFYNKFLGDPVGLEKEQVVFKIGETKLFFGLPYGEYKDTNKDSSGLNHLAFGVRNIEELKKFEDLLNNGDIKNSGIQIDKYGGKEFIWLDDPSGIRLELYLRPSGE